MTSVIASPALPSSESPADATTAVLVGGHSEAMIVCSVLAGHSGPVGSIRYLSDSAVRGVVRRVLGRTRHREVLAWRARVAPSEWSVRWDAAREVADRVFGGHVPGVETLPDVYRAYDTETSQSASE